MISLEQVSGNASGKRAAKYIVLTSAASSVLFFVFYIIGSVFIAQNLLPENKGFTADNVKIVTLAQQSGPSTAGRNRDLTPGEVAALTAKAVQIGKKLNLTHLRIELVNDKCAPTDPDSLCESRLTAYNDSVLDEALGTTPGNRHSGPEGVVFTMDIQDPVPFTWITSHGPTADNFFSSRVKDDIFQSSRQAAPLGTDRLVYHRLDAMLDRSIFELRGFGVFSPTPMISIYVVSVIAITAFFLLIRSRYTMSWARSSAAHIAGASVDTSHVQRTVTGHRTAKVYNPPPSSSSGGGFLAGGSISSGSGFSSGGGGFSGGGGGGFSGGGGGSSSGGGRG